MTSFDELFRKHMATFASDGQMAHEAFRQTSDAATFAGALTRGDAAVIEHCAEGAAAAYSLFLSAVRFGLHGEAVRYGQAARDNQAMGRLAEAAAGVTQ